MKQLLTAPFGIVAIALCFAAFVPSAHAQGTGWYWKKVQDCRASGGTWIQTATHDYCQPRQAPPPRSSTNAADDAARRQREEQERKRLEQQRREQEQRDEEAKAAAERAAEAERQREFVKDRDEAAKTLKGASDEDSGLKGESPGSDALKEAAPANTSGYDGELKKVEERSSAVNTDPAAEKVLSLYLQRDSFQAAVSFSAYSFQQQMRIIRPALKLELSDREMDIVFRMMVNMQEFAQVAPVLGITAPQSLRQESTRADYLRTTAVENWNAIPRKPEWKVMQLKKLFEAYAAIQASLSTTNVVESSRAITCPELEVARERDLAGCANQYQNIDNHKLAECTNRAIAEYQRNKDLLNCNR